jgi:hypothetical protein
MKSKPFARFEPATFNIIYDFPVQLNLSVRFSLSFILEVKFEILERENLTFMFQGPILVLKIMFDRLVFEL